MNKRARDNLSFFCSQSNSSIHSIWSLMWISSICTYRCCACVWHDIARCVGCSPDAETNGRPRKTSPQQHRCTRSTHFMLCLSIFVRVSVFCSSFSFCNSICCVWRSFYSPVGMCIQVRKKKAKCVGSVWNTYRLRVCDCSFEYLQYNLLTEHSCCKRFMKPTSEQDENEDTSNKWEADIPNSETTSVNTK